MKLNKIKIGLIALCLFITFLAYAHPFYVSITAIDFNPTKKRVEISCRLFYDDLEVALKNHSGKKIEIINPKNKSVTDSAIAKYIRKNLKLALDNKDRNLKYIGYEIEEDVAWCYFEVSDIQNLHKIDIINQLLYKDFKSQSNIMHINVNNVKKSTKLDNPKRIASFSF